MKVTNQNPATTPMIEQSKGTEKTKAADRAAETQGNRVEAGRGSEVTISERAQLMGQAADAAKAAPDVRWDRVETLKKQILDGTYKIDSETIAERILQDHIGTDFGKNNL